MGKSYNRKGQRANSTGRSVTSNRHVRLHYWLLETEAFRDLLPTARALLIELYALYSGNNNGYLFLSHREAGKRLGVNKDTAGRHLQQLVDHGFIRRRVTEPTRWSEREATFWILTEFEFAGQSPTKDFMKWCRPGNLDPRPQKPDTPSANLGQ